MRTPASQFLFGFLISFAPAPLVGFATYAIVHHKEPAPVEAVRPVEYGSPLDPDHRPTLQLEDDVEVQTAPEAPQEVEPPQEEEFQIRQSNRQPQQEIPKRKKPPGLPDF